MSSYLLNSTNYNPLIFRIEGLYGETRQRKIKYKKQVDVQHHDDFKFDNSQQQEELIDKNTLDANMIYYLNVTTYTLIVIIVCYLVISGLYAGFATCDDNAYNVQFNITETTFSTTGTYYTLTNNFLTNYPLWYFVVGFGFLCVGFLLFPVIVYLSILINYDEDTNKNTNLRDDVLYRKDGDLYFWISDAILGMAVYAITGQFIGIVEVFTIYCLVFSRFTLSLVGGFLHEYCNFSMTYKQTTTTTNTTTTGIKNWTFLALVYTISFLLICIILFTHMTYFDLSTQDNTLTNDDTYTLLSLQWILISLILLFDLIKGILMVLKYSSMENMDEQQIDDNLLNQVKHQNIFNFFKLLVQQLQYLTLITILLIQVLIY